MQLFTGIDTAAGRSWSASSDRRPGLPTVPNRLAAAVGIVLADLCSALLVLAVLIPLLRLASGHRVGQLLGSDQMLLGACIAAAIPSVLALSGRYEEKLPFRAELKLVLQAGVLAFLVAGCADTVLRVAGPVRLSACAWLCFPAFSIALRAGTKSLLDRKGLWRLPVLLVESPGAGASLGDILRTGARPGYRIASVLGFELAAQVGEGRRWRETLEAYGAAGVAIMTGIDRDGESRMIEGLLRERIPFFLLSRLAPLPVVGWRAVPFLDTIRSCCRSGRDGRNACRASSSDRSISASRRSSSPWPPRS